MSLDLFYSHKSVVSGSGRIGFFADKEAEAGLGSRNEWVEERGERGLRVGAAAARRLLLPLSQCSQGSDRRHSV